MPNKENEIQNACFPLRGTGIFRSHQRFEKSRSRGPKDCVPEHILCSPGIGAEPQQARKIPEPPTAVRVFFSCLWVQRHCLPVCNVFKHKHCLLILSFMEIRPNSYISLHEGVPNLIINKIGKQGIWRAICEKGTISDFIGSGAFRLVG